MMPYTHPVFFMLTFLRTADSTRPLVPIMLLMEMVTMEAFSSKEFFKALVIDTREKQEILVACKKSSTLVS